MENILYFIQIILSVLLVAVILMQQKGSGMGAAFGGDSNVYTTKRGADKVLFRATIILAVLFMLSAILSIFV